MPVETTLLIFALLLIGILSILVAWSKITKARENRRPFGECYTKDDD